MTRRSFAALAHSRKVLGLVLTLGLAQFSPDATARMYQWVSAATGTTQLSGEPPTWYRADGGAGPQVMVFEGGYLVDDTAIAVSDARRRSLRDAAFDELERRRTMEALRRLAKASQQARDTGTDTPRAESTSLAERVKGSAEDTIGELPELLDAEAIEKLKSIIQAFDRRGG